jgi:hypothetical protein
MSDFVLIVAIYTFLLGLFVSISLVACKLLELVDWIDHISSWYLVVAVVITVVSGCIVRMFEGEYD